MNNYGTVIFSDMQMEEPRHLCLRENGELYMCTVEKGNEEFLEANVCELDEQEAMIFVANASRKAIDAIRTKKVQNNKACSDGLF